MFNYEVMTEEEAMKARFQLLEDGDYPAVIKKVTPRNSASGNSMFDMDLDIYDDNGTPHNMRDFLVFTTQMMWKVIHCVESGGLVKEYMEKKLTPELLENVNVRVRVKTQLGSEIPLDKLKGKPSGSKYPDKNVIEDYLKPEDPLKVKKIAEKKSDFISDDIPF